MVEFNDRRGETVPGGRNREHIPVSEYKKHYTRGWSTSKRASMDSLEKADSRGEPTAWYDGYMDYAVGRPRGAHLEMHRKGQIVDEWNAEH